MLVVWSNVIVGKEQESNFEEWLSTEGFNAHYLEEFQIGNHNHVLFEISDDNIPKFSIFRIQMPDMHWWDDFISHYKYDVPNRLLIKYKADC